MEIDHDSVIYWFLRGFLHSSQLSFVARGVHLGINKIIEDFLSILFDVQQKVMDC